MNRACDYVGVLRSISAHCRLAQEAATSATFLPSLSIELQVAERFEIRGFAFRCVQSLFELARLLCFIEKSVVGWVVNVNANTTMHTPHHLKHFSSLMHTNDFRFSNRCFKSYVIPPSN